MSAARLLALLLVLRACEPFDVARSSRRAELAERRRLEAALGADFSRDACSAAVDTAHGRSTSQSAKRRAADMVAGSQSRRPHLQTRSESVCRILAG